MPEKKTATKAKTVKKPVAKTVKAVKAPVKAVKAVKVAKPIKEVKAPVKKAPVALTYIAQIGKRKNATASVRMFLKGSGVITVNGQPFEKYFDTSYQKKAVEQPIKQTGIKDMDFTVLAKGGGKNGQAEAARLGIARALIKFDLGLRPSLKAKGWLTRDPRVKERKKPGLKKARRAPQWSKR